MNEKNHQVAIMGSIFQRAQHVLLCVGHYNDDTEYCVEAIIDRLEQTPDTVDSLMDGTTDFKPVVLNDADPPPGGMYRNWSALKTFFKIWFDPADFLVLAASIGQLTKKELFGTSICDTAFSSFAMMAGRKLDAERSVGSLVPYFDPEHSRFL